MTVGSDYAMSRRRPLLRGSRLVLAGVLVAVALWGARPAAAQPAPGPSEPASHAAADAHGDGHEGGGLFKSIAKIVNFVLLFGGIGYVVRKPVAEFLANRSAEIRSDLVKAAETRASATSDLAAIEQRLRELPGELEALKARGRQEVEAEQQRLTAATAAERERLLAQARREVDQQLQGARRALTQEAADLAVGIARLRIAHEITDEDRARLLDRYVTQVKTAHE